MFSLSLEEYNKRVDKYVEDFSDYNKSELVDFTFLGGVSFSFFEEDGIPMGSCCIIVLNIETGKVVDYSVYKGKVLVDNSSGLLYGVNESLFFDKALDLLFIKPQVLILNEDNIFEEDIKLSSAEYIYVNNYTSLPIIEVSKKAIPGYIQPYKKRMGISKKLPLFRNVISSEFDNIGLFVDGIDLSVNGLGIDNEEIVSLLYYCNLLNENGYPRIIEDAKEMSIKPFSEKNHIEFLRNVCFDVLCDTLNIEGCREFLFLLKESGFFERLSKEDIGKIIEKGTVDFFKKDKIMIRMEKRDSKVSFFIGTEDSRGKFFFKEISFPNYKDDIKDLLEYTSKIFERNSLEQKEFIRNLKKRG